MGLTDENGVERANKNRGVYLEETLTHATNGSLGGKSLGNIYVEGGLNSLYSYHEKEKERRGISSWLGGNEYVHRTENSQEIYSLADIYSKKDIVYASDGKLTIKGADIYAEGSIHLSGKKGVSILPGTASSYYMEYLKKSGWTSNFSIGRGSISVGVGYAKSKSKYEQWNFDVIKSVIRADGDFIVVSEEGNYEQISTDINVKGNASITAKDIIIGDMASTVKIKQEQSSSYMGIGLSIGMPIVSTALALVDAAKNPERKMGGLNTVTAAVQARKALKDFKSAANAIMQGGNYFAVNLSLSFSKNKSKYQSEAVNSVGSALNVGGNLTMNGDNLHVTGSKIDVKGNIDYSILGNILVEAGRNAFSESSKSSGFSLGFSTNALDKENNFNPFGDKNGILQLGYSTNKSWADGVNWNVSTITAGGNTNYNVGGDVIYKGAVVTTGSVSGTIGGNLYTETLQDYFNGGQKGYSLSVGIGFGKHYEKEGNHLIKVNSPTLETIGLGIISGEIQTKLTNTPTAFIANGGDLDVKGKLTQIGTLIDGNFTLKAGSYDYRDLIDIYKDSYINASFAINPGILYSKKENGKNVLKTGFTIREDIRYRYRNQKRDVKATLGSGVTAHFDTQGVNRNSSVMIGEWEGKDIKETHVDLGLEMWLTEVGREQTRAIDEEFGDNIKKLGEIVGTILGKEDAKKFNNSLQTAGACIIERKDDGKGEIKIKGLKLGNLEIKNSSMIAEYEKNLNTVDQDIKHGKYNDQLKDIGLSEDKINEITSGKDKNGNDVEVWGVMAILALPIDDQILLHTKTYNPDKRYDLTDPNERLNIILGSQYVLSETYEKIKKESDKSITDYLTTKVFQTESGTEINVLNIIARGGKFLAISAQERRNIFEIMNEDLFAINKAVLEKEGKIELKTDVPYLVFDDDFVNGAGAVFLGAKKVLIGTRIIESSGGVIVMRKMEGSLYSQTKDAGTGVNGEIIFDNKNETGIGLTTLIQFLHESAAGHAYDFALVNAKITNPILKKQLTNDIYMLNNNKQADGKSGAPIYFDNLATRGFYYGFTNEDSAYAHSNMIIKNVLKETRRKWKTSYPINYEYMRDEIRTPRI